MGNRLVRECVEKFAHLNGNPYKALIWMCLRTLDDPDPARAIPAGFWWADWSELAIAIGWKARLDLAHLDAAGGDSEQARKALRILRDDVGKVCRELVAAGAIKKVPHPNRIDNAAYLLVLDPKPVAGRKGGRRRVSEPVDNVLTLDFGTVDTDDLGTGENHLYGTGENHLHPTGENHLYGTGENHLHPTGENHLSPINRNQEQAQEQGEEGVEEKGEDDTRHPAQPPDRARPVDNPAATAAFGMAMIRAGFDAAGKPRHARPAPVGNVRPDRE